MKEHAIPLLLSIVATLLNYIFISTITEKARQTQIQDFKTILNFMLNEIKSGQKEINQQVADLKSDVLSEVKQSGQKSKE